MSESAWWFCDGSLPEPRSGTYRLLQGLRGRNPTSCGCLETVCSQRLVFRVTSPPLPVTGGNTGIPRAVRTPGVFLGTLVAARVSRCWNVFLVWLVMTAAPSGWAGSAGWSGFPTFSSQQGQLHFCFPGCHNDGRKWRRGRDNNLYLARFFFNFSIKGRSAREEPSLRHLPRWADEQQQPCSFFPPLLSFHPPPPPLCIWVCPALLR